MGVIYHVPAYASHTPGLNFHTHDGSFHAHTQLHHQHQPDPGYDHDHDLNHNNNHGHKHEHDHNSAFNVHLHNGSLHAHPLLHQPHQHVTKVADQTFEISQPTPQNTILDLDAGQQTIPPHPAQAHHLNLHGVPFKKDFPSTVQISKDSFQTTVQSTRDNDQIVPNQVFPVQNFPPFPVKGNLPPSSLSQPPPLAQPSEIKPSHLTTDPPQVKPSFPELPTPAKSVQRQPQEQSDQIHGAKKPFIEPFFPILSPERGSDQSGSLPKEPLDQAIGAKTPLIEPFFPLLPPATISPDGARSELEAGQDERQRRRTEGLLGSGAGTRIEGARPPLKAEAAVPFVPVAGRLPPRTGLQDKEERKPGAGSQERPLEAPRQGAPRAPC